MTELSQDEFMIEVAKNRGDVRLANGIRATLLSWGCKRGQKYARVQFLHGSKATIPKTDILGAIHD